MLYLWGVKFKKRDKVMQTNIIGREQELQQLDRYRSSGKAEFVAIYGRRRVGKTFLVRNWAKNNFSFDVSGVLEGDGDDQMQSFTQALYDYGYQDAKPSNWFEAFICLRDLLKTQLKQSEEERILVFIDELPCFDTAGSKFVQALDHFWNTWAAWESRVMLVVCGSATSWMIRNLIDSHGGLHDRVTHEIHLHPFSLHETELYLQENGFVWPRIATLQAYMMLGGVPYYLSLLQNDESLAQAIDRLFFRQGGELFREYKRLFGGLFRNPAPYIDIIQALVASKSGLTRDEIAKKLKKANNGHLSQYLDDLEKCDFIRLYHVKEKKVKRTGGIYQLVDFYTLFYHTFKEYAGVNSNYWSNKAGTPEQNTWLGLAFEKVCLAHTEQIKRALHLDVIFTQVYSWRSKRDNSTTDESPKERGAQVDLVIERSDHMINLCECKYSANEYEINSTEDALMRNRIDRFQKETGTKCGIFPTFITTYGVVNGKYSANVKAALTMDDLFDN